MRLLSVPVAQDGDEEGEGGEGEGEEEEDWLLPVL